MQATRLPLQFSLTSQATRLPLQITAGELANEAVGEAVSFPYNANHYCLKLGTRRRRRTRPRGRDRPRRDRYCRCRRRCSRSRCCGRRGRRWRKRCCCCCRSRSRSRRCRCWRRRSRSRRADDRRAADSLRFSAGNSRRTVITASCDDQAFTDCAATHEGPLHIHIWRAGPGIAHRVIEPAAGGRIRRGGALKERPRKRSLASLARHIAGRKARLDCSRATERIASAKHKQLARSSSAARISQTSLPVRVDSRLASSVMSFSPESG